MLQFYLIPVEQIGNARGPAYFAWRFGTGTIATEWGAMDYGFVPIMLVVCPNIGPADHSFLLLQTDVYSFPTDIDLPVTDPNIDAFFEALNIPADWLTPSTTYRELLRNVAGLFQFNQRYGALSGGGSIFDNGRTLESNFNNMSQPERAVFNTVWGEFGGGNVQGNPKLRTLVKQAGDLWGESPFIVAGVEF